MHIHIRQSALSIMNIQTVICPPHSNVAMVKNFVIFLWRQQTVQVIRHTQRQNIKLSAISINRLKKANIFAALRALLGQSCRVRERAYLPYNGTILKLATVQFTSSSASGGRRDASRVCEEASSRWLVSGLRLNANCPVGTVCCVEIFTLQSSCA